MIWLTWRQHRKQALFTVAALAVLAALMIPTGLAMRHTFAAKGLDDCVRKLGNSGLSGSAGEACNTAFRDFNNQYNAFLIMGVLFLVVPLLVGLFWGAPLVARELEHGTHRLVWTQGISRRRWAAVKFGLVGAFTLLVATGYGLGMAWWAGPLGQTGQQSRFDTFFFDMQGLTPIGYTIFAVALGVFAGTVWPKMLPAMAATLVGFLGVRIVLTVLARPRYLAPLTRTYSIVGTPRESTRSVGDWILDNGIRDANGKLVQPHAEVLCPPNAQGPGGRACGSELGLGPGAYNWQLYQPGSRYWLFQSIETGIFVVLAVLLLYLAIRRVRRIA